MFHVSIEPTSLHRDKTDPDVIYFPHIAVYLRESHSSIATKRKMATPDPDMEEMCMISSEPRQRTCKNCSQVPHRNDYIEVRWCIDHLPNLPERWCIAEVLHISPNPEQYAIASGVIGYLPDEDWDEKN